MSLYLVGGVVRDLLLKRKDWDLDLTVEGDGIAFARLVADRYGAGLAVFERFATARLVFQTGSRWISRRPGESPMRSPLSCRRFSLRRSKRISPGGTSRSMP